MIILKYAARAAGRVNKKWTKENRNVQSCILNQDFSQPLGTTTKAKYWRRFFFSSTDQCKLNHADEPSRPIHTPHHSHQGGSTPFNQVIAKLPKASIGTRKTHDASPSADLFLEFLDRVGRFVEFEYLQLSLYSSRY